MTKKDALIKWVLLFGDNPVIIQYGGDYFDFLRQHPGMVDALERRPPYITYAQNVGYNHMTLSGKGLEALKRLGMRK